MGDVGAEVTRSAQSHLCVHVGTVHVDLAAELVDHLTNLHYFLLEDTVRRWIGQHQTRQTILELFGLRPIKSSINTTFHNIQRCDKTKKKKEKEKRNYPLLWLSVEPSQCCQLYRC